MSFINNPQVFQAHSPKVAYAQPYSFSCSFHDYEDQIVAYFSDRSCNAAYEWDTEKLKKRFEIACEQVERFVLLHKEE